MTVARLAAGFALAMAWAFARLGVSGDARPGASPNPAPPPPPPPPVSGVPAPPHRLEGKVDAIRPISGRVLAVDQVKGQLTVGLGGGTNVVLLVSTNTLISRLGKPSRLAEIAPGDSVGGIAEKRADGVLQAVSLRAARLGRAGPGVTPPPSSSGAPPTE